MKLLKESLKEYRMGQFFLMYSGKWIQVNSIMLTFSTTEFILSVESKCIFQLEFIATEKKY